MPETCNMTVLKKKRHCLVILTAGAQIKNKYQLSFKFIFSAEDVFAHIHQSIDCKKAGLPLY